MIELLSHCTPPSCVSANILSMISFTNPNNKYLVKDLPDVSFTQECRSLLVIITKTLAAHHLAGLGLWDQLCTDGTDRRQTEFENVVVGYMSNNGYKTVVLDATIIPDGKTAKYLTASILRNFKEVGDLLHD